MSSKKRIFLSLAIFILVIIIGAVGFKILGGREWSLLDSLYMTVITLSTVGYGEVYDISANPAARIFAAVFIILCLGTIAFAVSSITSFIVEGELKNILGRKKMEKEIAKLKDHYIVCGTDDTAQTIIKELIHITAGVNHNGRAGCTDNPIHPLQFWVDELVPETRPHLKPLLLPPIIPKVDGIDVVCQGFTDLSDIVVGNHVKEVLNKLGMIIEIHHEGFEAPERPGSLIERKTNLKDPESVAIAVYFLGDVLEKTRVERIRKSVVLQCRFLKNLTFNDADILVHASIPDNPKDVLNAIVPHVYEKPDVAPQLDQMIIQMRFEISSPIVVCQLGLGLLGEAIGPGDIGRLFMIENLLNNLPFGHSPPSLF